MTLAKELFEHRAAKTAAEGNEQIARMLEVMQEFVPTAAEILRTKR